MNRSYRADVIRLANKVHSESVLRRVYKILDREYNQQRDEQRSREEDPIDDETREEGWV